MTADLAPQRFDTKLRAGQHRQVQVARQADLKMRQRTFGQYDDVAALSQCLGGGWTDLIVTTPVIGHQGAVGIMLHVSHYIDAPAEPLTMNADQVAAWTSCAGSGAKQSDTRARKHGAFGHRIIDLDGRNIYYKPGHVDRRLGGRTGEKNRCGSCRFRQPHMPYHPGRDGIGQSFLKETFVKHLETIEPWVGEPRSSL